MRIWLLLQLEGRKEPLTILADRYPNVGEIINMFPTGVYKVAEIRNNILPTNTGLAYEISSTTLYCDKIEETP